MRSGIIFSLTASVVFGFLSYYSVFLLPLSGSDIFSWRVVFSILFLLIVILFCHRWNDFISESVAVVRKKYGLLKLIICSILVAVQLGIFGWAPINGEGQALAMGYFLLPLMLVLVGRCFYGELLTRYQVTAVALALTGVIAGLIAVDNISWVSLVVMLGFPPYFMLRKTLPITALSGVLLEHLIMIPIVALIFLYKPINPVFFQGNVFVSWGTLLGLGGISCIAILSYMAASQRLPMILFGMLGYVEPILLFLVAIIIGESVTHTDLLTYVPIWLAVGCLVLEGLLKMRKSSRVAI